MTNAPFRRQLNIQGRNSLGSDSPADSRRAVVLYFSVSFGKASAGYICYPAGRCGFSRTRGVAWRRVTAVLPGGGHELLDSHRGDQPPGGAGGSQQKHSCRTRPLQIASAFCMGVALGDAQQRARVGTCTKGGPEGCSHSKSLN